MLSFSVKNQIITRKDCFDIVADSKNYLYAQFEFTEEWTGDIIAVFGGADGKFYDVLVAKSKCLVPWEVIKAPFFTVSVFCGDLITSNSLKVEVERSGYNQGGERKEPTPDIYNQILGAAKAPYIGENGNWFEWDRQSNSFVDTEIKAQGDTPKRGKDFWTDEDKAEIKGYVDEAILGGAW